MVNPDLYFFAAQEGCTERLWTLLEETSPEDRRKLLETLSSTNLNDEKCTLLMVAAKLGNLDLINMLLTYHSLNLEAEGNVIFEGSLILGATALWVAAASGHGTIVTALIRKGADVNHATSTQSTPIRAACFAGKLDIVQYLVACGADIHIANKFNGTCLMIAAYNGYIDIVIYLIQNKVDVHVQASCGATALYFACQEGHLEIVKVIMARMNPSSIQANKLGMTPIKAAAERCRASVVEHFIDNLDISYDDKIDAIELLGASFANDKECYDHLKSLHYIRRALELRESENILKENLSEPISAYGNFSEIQSSSELRVMQNDEYRLQMEGLIMRERILGTSNLDVCHPIIYRGAMLADGFMLDKCILLWLHALRIEKSNKEGISMNLFHFVQLFCQMIRFNLKFDLEDFQEVLEACADEIELGTSLDQSVEANMKIMVYLMILLNHIESSITEEQYFIYMKTIHRLIKIEPRTECGGSLLHLAADGKHLVTSLNTFNLIQLPSSSVTKMLLKAGSNPEIKDNNGNTPLHHIAEYERHVSDFLTIYNIITSLLFHGAHIDAVNKLGKTPLDNSSITAKAILREKYKLRLKCLAAQSIQKQKLPFLGCVPADLEKFIRLHGP
ncbi:protein fem-1 homolog B isoform X1 [Lepeophtheirus salmonis]|uniref:protein fem-1 homolog B isoform X1 n=1 Tax=Lepeophtheirus salmonis TaxID=72036 RepID=UPI001AE9AB04|nr:protein fem-1 homolog B-like isoform X1 [Lepeophtheirus salmonis]